MPEIAKAYIQLVPTAKGIKNNIESELGGAGDAGGKKAGNRFAGAFKAVVAAAAIGKVLKDAITEGADLQQSLGGIETLFKDSADTVIANAKKAYETAGLSANEYMENVTSFSASLLSSLGGDTAKAAEIADMAMIDMSDNANKMGTDMEAIQNAYQGFAKQNYTMLDNLKLGYGGTKTEMERLLADAQKISGVEYNIDNLSDVYEAIHVIQGELDITGTTSKEASTTFTGSLNAMKAAATNLLGNLTLGEDIKPSLDALLSSAITFFKENLLPMLKTMIMSIVDYIPELVDGLVTMIDELLPAMIEAGVALFVALVKNLPAIIKALINAVGIILSKIGEAISNFTSKMADVGKNLILGLRDGIMNAVGKVIDAVTSVCKRILNKIKDLLGIHSPSRVMRDIIGENMMLGLAEGITGNTKPVSDAIDKVTAMTTKGFSSAIGVTATIGATAQPNSLITAVDALTAKIANMGIYLDGNILVGKTAERMGTALDKRNVMIARGVV